MSNSSSKKSGFSTTKIIGMIAVLAVGWVAKKYFPQFFDQGGQSKNKSQQEARDKGEAQGRHRGEVTMRRPENTQKPKRQPQRPTRSKVNTRSGRTTSLSNAGVSRVEEAFARKESGFMVTVEARVRKVLPDDNEGSRHQKLIIELSNRKTLLVAHNIDLAPRVPCRKGDVIKIRGQYEYKDKGGVLHWTHHDPRKRHPEGWIEFEGKTYE